MSNSPPADSVRNALQIRERTYLDFDAAVDNVNIRRQPNEHRLDVKINDQVFRVGRVTSAFPLSAYLKRVVFFNTEGEEIGCLKNASRLDHKSLELLHEELDKAYFMPRIESIKGIDDYLELELWQVQTNRGTRSFEVRNPRRNVRIISPQRMVVKDVDGNRYEIRDWRMMDRKSLALLSRHL